MGTFDLPHPGHVWLFQECRKIAGALGEVVVALNSDAFVARFKGAPPIQSFTERAAVVRSCRWVDQVIENIGDENAKPTIEAVQPDFLVIGSDWATRDYYRQLDVTEEWLDQAGVSLLYVPRRGSMSTTELKSRVREQR